MVCYARPVGMMTALVVAVLLVLGRPVGHFFGIAGAMLVIVFVSAIVAAASVLVLMAVTRIRRSRAVAGGCINCRFRCQEAMVEHPKLPPLASANHVAPTLSDPTRARLRT